MLNIKNLNIVLRTYPKNLRALQRVSVVGAAPPCQPYTRTSNVIASKAKQSGFRPLFNVFVSLSLFFMFCLVVSAQAEDNPILTINRIEGNNGILKIYYSVEDPEGESFITTGWNYSVDEGNTWASIDATAIGNNEPKPPGESFITWDTQKTEVLQAVYQPRVLLRMSVQTDKGSWHAVTPMPTARYGLAAATLNGKIYAIGGLGGGYLNTVEEYTPETNSWRVVAPMPTARDYLAAVALNSKIYAIGGYIGSGYLSTVEEYTPETDSWRAVASMPTARGDLAATTLNGKIYAIGGNNGSLNTVEEYTPETDSWRTVAPMPTVRSALAATTLNGKIYAIGGWNGNTLSTVEEYTSETNSWRAVAPMPTARYYLATATFNGKIYAIGGSSGSTVEEYTSETNSWRSVAPMPTARSRLASATLNGKIYAIGGDGGPSTVEEYTPPRASEYAISPSFVVANHITANIKEPAPSAYVRGIVSINGSAIVGSGQTLLSWILDKARGENPPSGYIPLKVANQPVQDAELAQWDTTEEADDIYTLRLQVNDTNGITVSDYVVVTVDNTTPPVSGAGNAIQCDGVNDYVDVGTSDIFNFGARNFSIEAWINPNTLEPWYRQFISKGGQSPFSGWCFAVYSDGRLDFSGLGAWEIASPAGIITTNAWQHVVVVRDGDTYSLYKDGVNVATGGHGGSLETSTLSLKIGMATNYTDNGFSGAIDEVRIWNVARTPEEIQAAMNIPLTGNEEGLAGYWRFDEAPGSTIAHDSSPNGNDGTLFGDAHFVESDAPIIISDDPFISVSPASLDFGSVVVDNVSEKILTVSNLGKAELQVTSIQSSDNQVTVTPDSFNLTFGMSQEVNVTFAPTSIGPLSAMLTIHSNDPDNGTVEIPVTGEGAPDMGSWRAVTPMPTARQGLAATTLDGNLYAIGGTQTYNFATSINTVEEYTPETSMWHAVAPMPTARADLASVALNGKIYTIGGVNFPLGGYFNTVEEYTPETDSWRAVTPMSTARSDLAAVALNGKIYAIGGCIGDCIFISTVEEYTPETDSWRMVAPMPTVRQGLAAVVLSGKIYVIGGIGGYDCGSCLNTVEEYTPETDSWRMVTPMPTARLALAASMLNGKIYAIGGIDGNGNFISTVEEYTPETDSWRTVTPMPTARKELAASMLNGKIYAIGGWSDICLSTVEEYTPPFVSDSIPPEAVTDLATSNSTATSIIITWTAPGDDGNVGTASQYDIRYSKDPITDANWDTATQCQGEPAPKPAGSSETFMVPGLSPNTVYYFALKTADEVPNWSPLSNVVQGTTSVECILGDVSGDGLALINDVVLLLKHIADPEGNPFDERQLCAGDMDGNGVILINDAVLLLKKIAEGAPGIALHYSSDTEAKIVISELKTKEGTVVKLTASSVIGGLSINLKYQNARLLDVKTFGLSALHQDGDGVKIAWLNDGEGKIAEVEFEGKPILSAEDVIASDSSGNLISADIIHKPMIDKNLLFQNYPNPFNPETWIPFQIKESADVTITIYDQMGHLIRLINLGKKEAGTYVKKDDSAYWDGRNENGERVAGGMYFYTITAGHFKATKKMIMLK